MHTKIYYGPDHRYWWVTELEDVPEVGAVVELNISNEVRHFRVQRVTLVEASPETDVIDRLHVWTKAVDLPGPWIRIPAPQWIPDRARVSLAFHPVISVDDWAALSRGADLSPYRPVTHRQRYSVPDQRLRLGEWSGDREDDGAGDYIDS